MNCQQVKKYIYAFLDNRTNLEQNLEIQEHMESCYSCSKEMKIEAKIGRTLGELSNMESCPQEVVDKMCMIIENIESKSQTKPIWNYRKSFSLKLLAVAASIFLFVSLSILARSYTAITKLPLQIKEIASYVESEASALDIVSSDVQNVRDELSKRVQFSFGLPKFTNYRAEIVGGRVCLVGGKKGAQIVYRAGDDIVSFYVLPDLNLDFSSLKSFELKGKVIYRAEYKGQKIFIWKQGSIYCALVSTISEDEMLNIVSLVIEEGLA